MTLTEFYCRRLHELREKKGITLGKMLSELAQPPYCVKSLELEPQILSELPDFSDLYEICDYFNITLADFFNTNYSEEISYDNISCLLKDLLDPVDLYTFYRYALGKRNNNLTEMLQVVRRAELFA